jgi:hypothetical protein
MISYQLTSLPPARSPIQRLSEWLGAAARPARPANDGADRIRLRRRSIPAGDGIPVASREDLLIVSGDVKLLREGRVVGMRYAGDTIATAEAAGTMTLIAHTDVCVMQLPRR